MNILDVFQKDVMRTVNPDLSEHDIKTMALFGLAGEAGEVADYEKKARFHGHAYDIYEFVEELGDVLWYLTLLAIKSGVNLEEVMLVNMEKRAKRYPNGFTVADSINREDV